MAIEVVFKTMIEVVFQDGDGDVLGTGDRNGKGGTVPLYVR